MGESFRLGGWGMYPTTILGLVLVITAIKFALDPSARSRGVIKAMSVVVAFSGLLGFVTGSIKTLLAAGEAARFDLALVGIGESLNNIGLALVLLVLSWIGVAVGTARKASDATASDTHAT
ncbi:hypothetical protein BH11MYX2_BH11MYX2_06110 [soil metagenome]